MVCEGEGKQGGACRDDYVLPAVKLVGDRCGVDGGAQLHVPQIASRSRVEGYEISVGLAGKHQTTRGGKRSAIGVAEVFKPPLFGSGDSVEGFERSLWPHDRIGHIDATQKVVALTIDLGRAGEDVTLV